jgi:hypothetical protein
VRGISKKLLLGETRFTARQLQQLEFPTRIIKLFGDFDDSVDIRNKIYAVDQLYEFDVDLSLIRFQLN